MDALQEYQKEQPSKSLKVLQLEGQLYFRLEQWQKCIETYENLLKNFEKQVQSVSELKTNLFAAYISAGAFKEAEKLLKSNKVNKFT